MSRADGTNAIHLTGNRDYQEGSWSPDGRRVALTHEYATTQSRDGGDVESDVVVADTRGRVLRNVSQGYSVFNDEPSWSPDGRYIVFHAGWRASALMVADLRTGEVDAVAGSGYNAEPAWSPDGRLIAYREESDHMTNVAPDGNEGIYVFRADGSDGPRLVIPNGASPAWSPDGRKIAYVVAPSNHSRWEAAEIAVANADGSDERLVTRSPEPEADPAWSPDGKTLAFTRSFDGQGAIVTAHPDGSNERVVVRWPGISVYDPAWRPARALSARRYARCPRR